MEKSPQDPKLEVLNTLKHIIPVELEMEPEDISPLEKEKAYFCSFIGCWIDAWQRNFLLFETAGIDNTFYNGLFYTIIEDLVCLHYPKEMASFIIWYVYQRKNPMGSRKDYWPIFDEKGREINISTIEKFWNFLQKFRKTEHKKEDYLGAPPEYNQ